MLKFIRTAFDDNTYGDYNNSINASLNQYSTLTDNNKKKCWLWLMEATNDNNYKYYYVNFIYTEGTPYIEKADTNEYGQCYYIKAKKNGVNVGVNVAWGIAAKSIENGSIYTGGNSWTSNTMTDSSSTVYSQDATSSFAPNWRITDNVFAQYCTMKIKEE